MKMTSLLVIAYVQQFSNRHIIVSNLLTFTSYNVSTLYFGWQYFGIYIYIVICKSKHFNTTYFMCLRVQTLALELFLLY